MRLKAGILLSSKAQRKMIEYAQFLSVEKKEAFNCLRAQFVADINISMGPIPVAGCAVISRN